MKKYTIEDLAVKPKKSRPLTVNAVLVDKKPSEIVLQSIGRTFNRLTVTRYLGCSVSPTNGVSSFIVEIVCECGTVKQMQIGNVRGGCVKSCGCVGTAKTVARSTKHGHSTRSAQARTFRVWCNILLRCNRRPSSRYFKNYGSRGISVCGRWSQFVNFLEDMGECPSDKHSIERSDNDGDYTPQNCVWATAYEQSNNRRNNRKVVVNGQVMNVAEAERALGLPRGRILGRLAKGWSIEDSVSTQTRSRRTNG